MAVYKTNVHMKSTYTLVPYVHLYIADFTRENAVLLAMMAALWSIPLGGRKQQQHDDTANQVLQFIIEKISVITRKCLEMEAVLSEGKATIIPVVSLI